MATRYTYQTTITVSVLMADDGETGSEGYETETLKWDSPGAQEESAREWANSAMPLAETYAEDWVTIDVPDLKLIKTEPAPAKECARCGGSGEVACGLPCDGPIPCPDCAPATKPEEE